MPRIRVVFFNPHRGRPQVVEWLEQLRQRDPRGFVKCAAALHRLAAEGHELRRPAADALHSGIRELPARRGRVHHRLHYFFGGQALAVVCHGTRKEQAVSEADIQRAIARKRAFELDPATHTFTMSGEE